MRFARPPVMVFPAALTYCSMRSFSSSVSFGWRSGYVSGTMGICHGVVSRSDWRVVLGFIMCFCLHLLNEPTKTLMDFVDLARQIREIGMQIDFRAAHPAMTGVTAHVEQFHAAFF